MLSKRENPENPAQHCHNILGATLHMKSSCSMLSEYSWDNTAQVRILFNIVLMDRKKILFNVVQESPDNIAQEKMLLSIALIFLGQHCTAKVPVQCCLNTLGTTLHR